MKELVCPQCFTYLLDHNIPGWKACPSCNFRRPVKDCYIICKTLNINCKCEDKDENRDVDDIVE